MLESLEVGKPTRGPRILVVDDDDESRQAVKDVLEESGFVVTEASDGKIALDFMTCGLQPALVILDLRMPVMSGLELLEIMDNYERLSRFPVLVLSGTARSDFACGGTVVGFISKPPDMQELLTAVKTCIGSRDRDGRDPTALD